MSAPFTYRPVENGNCEDGSWWCVKTYDSSYAGWKYDLAGHPPLRQHGLRPAPRSTSGPSGSARWRGSSASGHRSRSAATTCPRWASARSRSRRSTWLRPTPRWPRAACTPSRPRSAGRPSERQGGHQGPLGSPEADARDSRRSRLEGDPDSRGQRQYGTGTRASSVGLRPERPGRPTARGCLVRRLHARTSRPPSGWGIGRAEIPMETSTASPSSGGSFPGADLGG